MDNEFDFIMCFYNVRHVFINILFNYWGDSTESKQIVVLIYKKQNVFFFWSRGNEVCLYIFFFIFWPRAKINVLVISLKVSSLCERECHQDNKIR